MFAAFNNMWEYNIISFLPHSCKSKAHLQGIGSILSSPDQVENHIWAIINGIVHGLSPPSATYETSLEIIRCNIRSVCIAADCIHRMQNSVIHATTGRYIPNYAHPKVGLPNTLLFFAGAKALADRPLKEEVKTLRHLVSRIGANIREIDYRGE